MTCAANCWPEAAFTVTVAGWPIFTEPMSDSLSDTSIVNRCTFTRVMKPELDDWLLDELELALESAPRPLATEGEEPLELPLDEPEDPDEPAVMLSPTAPLTAATVPLVGATSFVAASAFSALVTVSFALSTPAAAAATDTVLPLDAPLPDPPLDCAAGVAVAFFVLVCLGVVVVFGAVVDFGVVVGFGVVVVGVVVAGVVPVGVGVVPVSAM